MVSHATALEESLGALLQVCEQEQEALVSLDAEAIVKLIPRKASLLSQVAGHVQRVGGRMPAHLLTVANRCRRLNAANRKMLVLTVRCLDSLLADLAPKPSSPYAAVAGHTARGRRVDRRA